MGNVNLSAEQVYSEIRTVSENVVRLITKMDTLVDSNHDHEVRLRGLERKVWLVSGAGTFMGVLAGVLSRLIFKV